MRVIIISVLCFFSYLSVSAQNVQDNSTSIFDYLSTSQDGYGEVSIIQDYRLRELVDAHKKLNLQNDSKIQGWRVQIYNSSGVNSRKDAESARKSFLEKHPDVPIYVIYQPPFFKIRVGDYRTREDAYMFYKQIITEYPVSYLVSDVISLPAIE